jgi:WD40 repeat protein
MNFSMDGELLATFGWDSTNGVQAWNVAGQKRAWVIRDATSVGGFSADGKVFVAGNADRSVRVYHSDDGELLRTIRNAGDIVAFAPAAKSVVTMHADRVLNVRGIETGRTLMSLTNAARRFFDVGRNAPVAISTDGEWLALVRAGDPSEPKDRGVELWNVASGAMEVFLPHARQIRILQFAPRADALAVADGDGEVALWNWKSGQTRTIRAHALPVQSLAFSSSGDTLATGASDEAIKLWDAKTLTQKPMRLDGQLGTPWSMAFSPNESLLASGSRDMPILLWDVNSAVARPVITNVNSEKVGNFAFSPDGKWMAAGCQDRHVRIWDVKTSAEKYRMRGFSYIVSFTQDGKRLLVADAQGVAYWWDFAAGTQQALPAYEQLGEITSVEFSPNRRVAALGHKSGKIQLIEIDTGTLLGIYEGHRDAVLSLTFTPDGRAFASGARDKEIRFWDVGITNRSRQVCTEHKGPVAGLAISSDGKTMVSGCSANTIKFWELERLDQSLGGRSWHRSAIRTLAFSPDGQRVASGSEDHTIKLWDFKTRRELARFDFDAAIRLAIFSSDSNYLAVVTDKGSLHLLAASTLAEADQEIRNFYVRR